MSVTVIDAWWIPAISGMTRSSPLSVDRADPDGTACGGHEGEPTFFSGCLRQSAILCAMRTLLCPSLIGRERDLDEIRDALASAGSREGSAVFVRGEAGVGKSRLVREGVAEARRARFSVLFGRAVQGQSTVAFRPVAEALN